MKMPWEPGLYGNAVVFEPTTIAMIAVSAAVAGTAVSAMGAMSQAKAASNAADFNAKVAANNAIAVRQQAEQQAELQQRQAQHQMGAARAAYGAGGVTAEGSPLDVLASSASAGELDRQTILYKANLQAAGYTDEQALDNARSSTAMAGGVTSAAGLLLSGGAKAYSMWPGGGAGTPITSNAYGDPNL